ncbi:hypothetical protein [Nonomuraea gerenzanensis]|uniref:Uncharacterized protein n=1 Tax=Nonomuraea gerenzanensis TaxID=93944 RepID=A0A1M4EH24_9ACTN|nr:hypothetical protein [Nonomuraea gerenzanensis]UBU09818.1 hypothetical protein LCN96_36430 [Nonomuraea gerenzanensis]SBO98267.1 hypothetical protein BN4615_P7783 [Nonomuraea gerenzanensis]
MGSAAIGVRDHCGWAVLVAVTGGHERPEVLMRERVTLLDDPALPDQPYHAAVGLGAAAGLGAGAAGELIALVERSARTAAGRALGTAARALAEAGHHVRGVALDLGAVGAGRMVLPGELAEVLAKHHYLHGAEGELYHEALVEAAGGVGLAVSRYDFKRLRETAAQVLGPEVPARVDALRARVGTPWTRDHKDAALGALLVLHARE